MNAADRYRRSTRTRAVGVWIARALPLLIAFALGFVSCVLLVTFAYR